jgi:hypothetical protein
VSRLVQEFVERINKGPRELLLAEGVPPSLRVGEGVDGFTDWQIAPSPPKTWLQAFEALLPAPFPPSVRELLTHYTYPEFEFFDVWMYPNTGELERDFDKAVLQDKHLVRPLLAAGFVPFARPAGGSYDPLCFDCRHGDGEWPIVRADHERALINDAAIVLPWAKSFVSILESFLCATG